MGITNSNLRVPAVAGTTYVGCYHDLTGSLNGSRLLADAYVSSYDMSVERCAAAMSSYKYFGLEYANECFGANMLSPAAEPAATAMCDFQCIGAMSEPCGAANYINVFQNNAPAALPQCSLIVTSYIAQATITQPATTITSAAVTVTVTATLNTALPSSTTSPTATNSATPTSLPADFFLYAAATDQYLTDKLVFSDVPSGTFRLNGSRLLVTSSLLPIGVPFGGAAGIAVMAPLPDDGFLEHGLSLALTCSIDSRNNSVACTLGGQYPNLASCVGNSGNSFLATINTPESATPFNCSYVHFVAVSPASYHPHSPESSTALLYI